MGIVWKCNGKDFIFIGIDSWSYCMDINMIICFFCCQNFSHIVFDSRFNGATATDTATYIKYNLKLELVELRLVLI